MKISEIPNTVKAWLSAIILVVVTGVAAYGHFTTDAEAAESHTALQQEILAVEKARLDAQEQQIISNNRAEIWRAKREINRLQADWKKASEEDRIDITNDIKEYSDLIDCIQLAKDLCY